MLEALRKYLNENFKWNLHAEAPPVEILEAYEDVQEELHEVEQTTILRAMPEHTTEDEFERFIAHLEFMAASTKPLGDRV
jgi:acyl dehydratase